MTAHEINATLYFVWGVLMCGGVGWWMYDRMYNRAAFTGTCVVLAFRLAIANWQLGAHATPALRWAADPLVVRVNVVLLVIGYLALLLEQADKRGRHAPTDR